MPLYHRGRVDSLYDNGFYVVPDEQLPQLAGKEGRDAQLFCHSDNKAGVEERNGRPWLQTNRLSFSDAHGMLSILSPELDDRVVFQLNRDGSGRLIGCPWAHEDVFDRVNNGCEPNKEGTE